MALGVWDRLYVRFSRRTSNHILYGRDVRVIPSVQFLASEVHLLQYV